MRRSVLLVPVLALALGATPACSDKTNGSAVPGGPTGGQTGNVTTTTSKGTSTTRSTSGGSSPLAGKDPCALLPKAAQDKLGISRGEKRNVGSARTCRWEQRAQTGDLYLYTLALYDSLGIKDIPADAGAKPLADIGRHKAVQTTELGGQGSCSVTLGVTDTSRASAGLITGTDQQKACELAMEMAKLVEPELP